MSNAIGNGIRLAMTDGAADSLSPESCPLSPCLKSPIHDRNWRHPNRPVDNLAATPFPGLMDGDYVAEIGGGR